MIQVHKNKLQKFFCIFFAVNIVINLSGCTASSGGKASSVTAESSEAELKSDAYTFVWMSDTQYYSETYPDIYKNMTEWIAFNRQDLHIQAVIHTGDVTNNDTASEWKNAVDAMNTLEGVIPYTILPGNKDITSSKTDNFVKYFGKNSSNTGSNSMIWYQDGSSRALPLDIGTTKFLIVALGWEADSDAITWADKIIKENADRIVILTTHDYLDKDASLSDNGKKLFKSLVKHNTNVHLVLCGHKYTADQLKTEIDDNGDGITDRTVYQIIADYQNAEKGGDGYLRLLTVDESAKTLTVKTYSPYLNKYNCFDSNKDEFTISISEWFK